MDLNSHGTDDQLEAYVLGRLHSGLLELEEHLMICEGCRDRLDAAEVYAVAMAVAIKKEALETGQPASVPQFLHADWFRLPAHWFPVRLRLKPALVTVMGLVALIATIGALSSRHTKFAPVAVLQLTASRGDMPLVTPVQELDLAFSDAPRNSAPLTVEVVSATGDPIWSGLAGTGAAGLQVKVRHQFSTGDYFVRLYSTSGTILREYGFRIRP